MAYIYDDEVRSYESNPRAYALSLVEQGVVPADKLLLAALKFMSWTDVQSMLDMNELSPRFLNDDN